jgi:two-component system OmpR family response regulator
MRVLIVEDDVKLAGLIQRALREQAALADAAHDGEDALWMADATPYDVMVLDVNLPGINGFETCQRLRQAEVHTPILILTARAAIDDKVAGLDTGAGDYLVKPFDVSEMLARVRALARRGPATRGTVLRVGDLSLDGGTRVVCRGSTPIALSTKEFQLLEVFMRRPGQVLSRYDLLEGAWDMAYENRSNVVDVYVRYLREKIDRPFGLRTIETVRGAGYRLRAPARQPLRVPWRRRGRPLLGGGHAPGDPAAAQLGTRHPTAQTPFRGRTGCLRACSTTRGTDDCHSRCPRAARLRCQRRARRRRASGRTGVAAGRCKP